MNAQSRKRRYETTADGEELILCDQSVHEGSHCDQSIRKCSDEWHHCDDAEVPVIIELQEALNELISRGERQTSNASTKNKYHDSNSLSQQHSKQTNEAKSITDSRDSCEEDKLKAIPYLINRILLEYFPTATEKDNASKSNEAIHTELTVDQKILMTQLLIAVITEFSEPHFLRVAKMQQNQYLLKMGSKSEPPLKPPGNELNAPSIEFSERAVAWATSCLSRLLQISLSTDEPTHIAELDALLGATGENDGMELEEMMQQSLLCGVMGARSNAPENLFER